MLLLRSKRFKTMFYQFTNTFQYVVEMTERSSKIIIYVGNVLARMHKT